MSFELSVDGINEILFGVAFGDAPVNNEIIHAYRILLRISPELSMEANQLIRIAKHFCYGSGTIADAQLIPNRLK